MEKISHRGIVESKGEQSVSVRIVQTSACDLCRARNLCTSADKKEKLVEAVPVGGPFAVGQEVEVVGTAAMGLKAVFWAYVLPLVVMVAVLAICVSWLCPGREGLGALLSLASLVLYYTVIALLRPHLGRHFRFEAHSVEN